MSTEAPQNPGSHKMKSFRLFRRKRRAQEEVSASDTNAPETSVISPPKKRPSLLARFVIGCAKIVLFVACLGALQLFVFALTTDSAKKLDETAQKIARHTSTELARFDERLTTYEASLGALDSTVTSLRKDVVKAFSSPEWGYIAALVRSDENTSEVRRHLASQAEKAVSLARSYMVKGDIDSAGQCYLNALNLLYGDMEIISDVEARFRKLAENQVHSGEMTEAQTTLFALNELLTTQLSRVDPSDLEKLLASSAATIEEVQRIGETQLASEDMPVEEESNPEDLVARACEVANTSTSSAELAELMAELEILPPDTPGLEDARAALATQNVSLSLSSAQALQDENLRRIALSQLAEPVNMLRLRLAQGADTKYSDATQKALDSLVGRIDSAIESERAKEQQVQEKAVRDYQSWAVEQIQACALWNLETAKQHVTSRLDQCNVPGSLEWPELIVFPSLASHLRELSGADLDGSTVSPSDKAKLVQALQGSMYGWKNDTELARLVVRDSIVEFLLPIELGILDVPLQTVYQEVYQEASASLDSRDNRLYVAKMSIDVKKKQPSID